MRWLLGNASWVGGIAPWQSPSEPSPVEPVFPRQATSDLSTLLFAGHSFGQTPYGQPAGEPISFGGILQTDWPGATLSDYQAYASMQQIWDLNGNLRNGEYDVAIITEFTPDFTNGFPAIDTDATRASLQSLYWAALTAHARGAELILQDVWSPQGSDLRTNVHGWFQFARQWLSAHTGRPIFILPISPYVMAMRDQHGDVIYEDGLHLLKSGPYPRGTSYLVYSMLTQQRCPFVRSGDEALNQLAWDTLTTYECAGMGGSVLYPAIESADPLPNPAPLP